MKHLLPLILLVSLLAGCTKQEIDQENLIKEEYNEWYTKTATGVSINKAAEIRFLWDTEVYKTRTGDKVYADPVSFEFLSGGFAKDKNLVFFKGLWLSGIDTKTFQVLNENYSKDSHSVLRYGKVVVPYNGSYDELYIVSDEAENFQIINNLYAKDAKKIYPLHETSITSGDPKSFHLVQGSGIDAEDNKFTYYQGKIVTDKLDPDTQILTGKKQVMISDLGKEITIPERWKVETKRKNNKEISLHITTDQLDDQRYPVYMTIDISPLETFCVPGDERYENMCESEKDNSIQMDKGELVEMGCGDPGVVGCYEMKIGEAYYNIYVTIETDQPAPEDMDGPWFPDIPNFDSIRKEIDSILLDLRR